MRRLLQIFPDPKLQNIRKRFACPHDLQGGSQAPVWAYPTGWREKHSVVQRTVSFAAPMQLPAFSYLQRVLNEAV